MKSLMTFIGILAFNFNNFSLASDFSCPVNANSAVFTCSGTVKVKNLAELNSYRNDLGVVAKKPTVAKNLQIDFNPDLTSDLVISTPCSIKIPSNITMTSTANICLHGKKGVSIDDNFKFTGKNLKLESSEEVALEKNFVIKAQDIKLLSMGSGDTSKAHIRENSNIEAANLTIESNNKGFVGKNSIVKLTGMLGIYSLGDDEASVREATTVQAAKIEVSSSEETRIAKNTNLLASEIILNGVKCTINKTAVITAEDRLGNCFLTSTTNKAKFSINKNQGKMPLTVAFNASTIADAKGFVWSFGDGETLNSLTPTVNHTYNRIGSFTATLKYATKDNYKGLKSAGAIQIDVKAESSEPVEMIPPKGYFNYEQDDDTFVYFRSFIKKTQFDIASAYYVVDDNQNNKIIIPNFYANAVIGADLGTYGKHRVVMHVEDVQGQKYSKAMNVFVTEDSSEKYPFVRLDGEQSAARTAFFDLSTSFIPETEETLKDFHIDFGDGQSANLVGITTITHTYAQAGTYHVVATATYEGNEEYDEIDMEVTNENTPMLNPVAGFQYNIYDFAGNVVFADERSGTPNGEIISYVWDFGDGTIGYGKNASNFYAPGTYLVTLTVTDTAGMRASQTQQITIVEEGDEIAAMLDCWSDGGKHLGCETVALDKFNEIVRVKLEWGDGTQSDITMADQRSIGFSIREHEYFQGGTYSIKLIIDTARGVRKVITYNKNFVEVPEPEHFPPVADLQCFSNHLYVYCNGLGSYDYNGGQLEYIFTYADGYSERNYNGISSHSFIESGVYAVKLEVKNKEGLSSTMDINIQALARENNLPKSRLSCESRSPHILHCNALSSSDEDGYIVEYKYIWGEELEEKKSNGSEIFHIFSSGGNKIIKLIVTDNDGGVNETFIDVNVLENHSPKVTLSCLSNYKFTVSCQAIATDNDLNDMIVSYEWDMGDGIKHQMLIPNINYEYGKTGDFNITVKVSDSLGASAISSQTVKVMDNAAPIAEANCGIFSGNVWRCSALGSYDPDGLFNTYYWTVDGVEFDKIDFTYEFVTSGHKEILLQVKDDNGKITEKKIEIDINLPVSDIECSEIESMVFRCEIRQQFIVDNDVKYVIYKFNSKDVLAGRVVEYEFVGVNTNNLIEVQLIKNNGDVFTITRRIYITPRYLKPKPEFVHDVSLDKKVYFNGSLSKSSERLVMKYVWDFGNGVNIETSNDEVMHTFNSYGWHDVKLKVYDYKNNVSEISYPIYVYDPEVEISVSNNQTVEGVDSDGDGVRDDMQVWINKVSYESENAKRSLRNLYLLEKEQELKKNDVSELKRIQKIKNRMRKCVDSELEEEFSIKRSDEFEIVMYNTNERLLASVGLMEAIANEDQKDMEYNGENACSY